MRETVSIGPKKETVVIVVTGATGKLGRLVLDALLQTVPAMELAVAIRTPSKAADLAARGVQVRHGDYDRPDTLSGAFKPGEKVLLISANEVGKRAVQHLRVIEAARAANVALLAYTSLLRADRSTLILAEEHRTTEEAIHASGLPYVFLRNGWYLENHTEQLHGTMERGVLVGAAAQGRFASAARRDYADAAAAVLTADVAGNVIYELAGDGFTLEEFAAEVTRQSGNRVTYSNLTLEQYEAALVGSGMPAAVAHLVADFDRAAAHGDLNGSSDPLRRLIRRPPTSVREAIAGALTDLAQAREGAVNGS
jgi:NAD(P)H dehydrogenase (quinone)